MIEDINYLVGQRWIELAGSFTSDELRKIALEIDRHYEMAFKKPNSHDSIENNGNTK